LVDWFFVKVKNFLRGRQFAGHTADRVGKGKVGAGTEWNEIEWSEGIKLVWDAEVAELSAT